jgi:hypothetical protein
MRVTVTIQQEAIEGDYGGYVDGLRLTCSKCGHEVTVFGTETASARRGAIMLRDECPDGNSNFYDVRGYS